MKSKPGRPKKSRASKASRASTQSNFTAVSEGPSIVQVDPNVDEPLVSDTDPVKPTKPARGKKATKGKRANGKTKGKGTKTTQEESQVASSFIEPEDDDFEVKVDASPALVSSNKKRKSDEVDAVNERLSIVQTDGVVQSQAPAKKQRRTRASSTVALHKDATVIPPSPQPEADAPMTDAESMPPPPGPVSKKKGKGGKQRASSAIRKASGASTASKASLRAIAPTDEEIEAALKADLNRPLTDEEGDTEPIEAEPPKNRRLTRSKSGPKKATASVAPTRRGTRANSVTTAEPLTTNLSPPGTAVSKDSQAAESEASEDDVLVDGLAEYSPDISKNEAKTVRHHLIEQHNQTAEVGNFQGNMSDADQDGVQRNSPTTKPQQTKGRQASRQLPARNVQASACSDTNDAINSMADANSSVLDTRTVQDDSGHETDASVAKPSRTKRLAKVAPAAAKKAKREKKVASKSQKVGVVSEPAVDAQSDENYKKAPEIISDPADTRQEPPKESAEESLSTTEVTTNENIAPATTERNNALMENEDIPPVPAPQIHSTPRPAFSSQSSDAENQPPSARPSSSRPPISFQSPSKSQITRVPLAITPISSPSKGSFSKLQSTFPWTAVDLETIFQGTPSANKENDPFVLASTDQRAERALTSPEKKLTVEEWIKFNAQRGEERLRNECERLVGRFEGEGVKALRTLEGIVCAP